MSGRLLTERLLATSSLAALLLATAGINSASAFPACSLVPAGGSLINSASIPCVEVTTNAIGITNTASGRIGGGLTAISVQTGVTLSGGINNAGTIATSAAGGFSTAAIAVSGIVQGGISNSGTVTFSSTASSTAEINGIFVGGTSFGGGLTNNGTIAGTATSTGSCAGAVGIRIEMPGFLPFTGNVANSGTVAVSASGAGGIENSFADAIEIDNNVLIGNVTNSGTISAAVTQSGTDNATAAGIFVNVVSLIGGIANSGTIGVSAINTGSTSGACARGLTLVTGPSNGILTGGFSNSGKITVSATAANGFANATGVDLQTYNITGGINNSGVITVSATGADAIATALSQFNGISSLFASTLVSGGFINTGTLAASAIATAGNATAVGAGLGAFSTSTSINFSGGFSNGGIISSAATASGTAFAVGAELELLAVSGGGNISGGVTNSGQIIATATGAEGASAAGLAIEILAVTGAGVLSGDVVNSGTISATATAANGAARASGLLVYAGQLVDNFSNGGTITATATANGTAGTAFATGALVSISGMLSGTIANSGVISATATENGALLDAGATGLIVYASTFVGSFSNSGTIAAAATAAGGGVSATGVSIGGFLMTGGVANSGVISATATQTANASSCANAVALSSYASTMFGNVTNSGTIVANAIAMGTATRAWARATGANVGATLMTGNVVNSGLISATATQNGGNTCAEAFGLIVSGATMLGNVSNSGTIAAAGTALTGYATVIGMQVGIGTMMGSIVNSGTISATATGAAGSGHACAIGLNVDGEQFAAIGNSGRIAASATGNFGCAVGVQLNTASLTGDFTNSGTIAASFTATGGGSGVATGIRFNATSFSGTLTNSGTITATRTGAGTAIGINVDGVQFGTPTIANSGTISASDIAINLTNSGVAFTIDQTAGHILGNTAIAFSQIGDTLNASGGKIEGALVGPTSGTLPTINVAAGAGGTFTYAGVANNIGIINVNSGTMLLATQANGAASVVSTATFTQAAGGTLGLGALPAAISSVTASGALTLAGPLVVYEGAAGWNPSLTYTYANALVGDTLTGAFSSVGSNSPLFTASATKVGNSETVTLGLLPLGSVPGLSGNDRSVLTAIESLLANPNTPPSLVTTLGQIYTLNSTSQVGTLATSLSGQQNTQNFQFSESAWSQFSSMLIDRLFGDGGTGTTGVASFNKDQGLQFAQADIPQVAQASDAARPGVAPAKSSPWGVWARGYGSWASAPSTASSASYDESGAGVIIGGDAQIAQNLVGGFAVNIGSDSADISGGSRNNINTYQGALYGKYAVDQNIYVAGLVGFGWQDYDSRRFIAAPISASATANYSGQGYRLYGESGYAFHLSGPLQDTSVTPYLGLGYLRTHVDGFTEAGGGGAALAVGAVDANSFTTSLGARASTVFRIGRTALKPEVRVAWEHEWLDESTNVQSAFAAAPGSVFTVTGAGFGRDSFVGGAGISTTLAGFGVTDPRFAPTQLFVDYDVKTTGGYVANVVSGGFRAKF